jgi:transcription-repair coupling factor (superfamily II helicase)
VFAFREDAFPDPAPLVKLVSEHSGRMQLRPDRTLFIRGDWETPETRLAGTRKWLETLAETDAAGAA